MVQYIMLSMFYLEWQWQPITILFLFCLLAGYITGWQRLHHIIPALATPQRLVSFCAGIGILGIVLLSPLYALSGHFLFARSIQKVLLCMVAAPLIWLSCPFHMIMWAMPSQIRRTTTRLLLRNSPTRAVIRVLTQPGIAWLTFVCTFMLWHDPDFAAWTLQSGLRQNLALWFLMTAALLYWWHVIGTGPRIHQRWPGWLCIASLVGVEIPNMLTGVSIAFNSVPIYTTYVTLRQTTSNFPMLTSQISVLEDQMLGGGLTWVIGSMVYITTIVLVINRLFKEQGKLLPPPQFNEYALERTIAPGLEHRVREGDQ